MYAVISKGPVNLIRDGTTGKMRQVTPYRWELFDALPHGMAPIDSPTSRIKILLSNADLDVIEAENELMRPQQERLYGPDDADPQDKKPKGRKGK